MAFILNTIALPEELHWSDRYDWTAVLQDVEVGLAGTFLVEESDQLSGRPITLLGKSDECWINKSGLDAIDALLSIPGLEMSLDLGVDGIRSVIWRRDINSLIAEPLKVGYEATEGDLFALKQLAFFEI